MDSRPKIPPFQLDRSRSGSLEEQLAAAMRAAIKTGYYGAGEAIPPTRELAVQLGVSRTIAIRAMRRLEEDRLVVRRPHLGCVVCPRNQPLWKGNVLLVVPPGLANPFDNAVRAAVRDALTAAGYLTAQATVPETRPGRFDDFSLLETMLRQQTDLVVQLHDQENIARWLARRGVPFVRLTADGDAPRHCVGLVRRRNDLALDDFAAHCREAGVRSVLQVTSPYPCADAAAALGALGIRVETLRKPRAEHDDTGLTLAAWAADAFAARLASPRSRLPDLLFFQDDNLATGAFVALLAAGIRIPDDVRVVTWANRCYGPVFTKPLTRMEMDDEAAGADFAACVLDFLRTGTFPEGREVGPAYVRGETM